MKFKCVPGCKREITKFVLSQNKAYINTYCDKCCITYYSKDNLITKLETQLLIINGITVY